MATALSGLLRSIANAVGTGQEAVTGDPAGAQVAGISFGDAAGRLVHDPTHPLADAQGMVRYPDMDMGDQMTQLMVAQRGYQANLAAVDDEWHVTETWIDGQIEETHTR